MLVVIAIIALLAGLLLPAVTGGVKRGKVARAQTEVKLIEQAMSGYLSEYGKFPGQDADTADHLYQSSSDYQMLIATLRGSNTAGSAAAFMGGGGNQNPREKVFLTVSDAANTIAGGNAQGGELADPWGNRYNVAADWTMDGFIRDGVQADGEDVTNRVAVWSWGPEPGSSPQADRNNKAHIRSWRAK
jgi:type II secretory pathway pseudopilin PulG